MTNKKQKPEHRHGTLSIQDRFYIENNGNMSVEELAAILKQPVEVIQEYCDAWLKAHPQDLPRPAKNLMERPSKGVVSMTGPASQVADETYNKYVTVEAINQAMARGDHETAKKLKKRLDDQDKERKDIIRNKYVDKIHYIIPPDDDDEVF
jgi:hypothetical protein